MYLANHSLSFNLSIYQVAGLENLASADPHSRLWQPEGQYMAEPSYVCRYVPKHQKAHIAGSNNRRGSTRLSPAMSAGMLLYT
jgi:hypothetical protein